MLQDIRVPKILPVLFTSENMMGILGGTLLAGPNDTANLIFNLQHALSEV